MGAVSNVLCNGIVTRTESVIEALKTLPCTFKWGKYVIVKLLACVKSFVRFYEFTLSCNISVNTYLI